MDWNILLKILEDYGIYGNANIDLNHTYLTKDNIFLSMDLILVMLYWNMEFSKALYIAYLPTLPDRPGSSQIWASTNEAITDLIISLNLQESQIYAY